MKKTLIIAEAGVNHNGSIEIAKKLIDAAVEAGVDYVKFQTFKADKLVSKKAQKASYQQVNSTDIKESQYEMIKKLELDLDKHKLLISYCKQQGIKFLSTAFDVDSVDLLESLGINLFKIPSGEITNLPFLRKIASKQKKIILSTGMSNLDEISDALSVLSQGGIEKKDITVLHCNTEYPSPFSDVNLRAMDTIKRTFGVEIGYSDHTLGIEVSFAAVAMGAVCIEKHFTLDRTMKGPDHSASLEPEELKAMVSGIRNIELALGDGIKKPSLSESKNIIVARKSIHTINPLAKGHIIREIDLEMKRPGNGISPMSLDLLIGKSLTKDLAGEHLLTDQDFR